MAPSLSLAHTPANARSPARPSKGIPPHSRHSSVYIVTESKMADTSNPNAQNLGFTEKLKTWLSWSWTYIWALWFAMVLVLLYVLRSPLKLQETLSTGNRVGGTTEPTGIGDGALGS